MTDVATHRLEANGVEICFDEAGQGDRPFVLIHGFTGHRKDFEFQLPALAERGRTIAPSLRGHGDSERTGDAASYTLDALAADMVDLLDRLGVGRFDLLGHSMGGLVAQRIVLGHPERVASLVLMDTAGRAMSWFPRQLFTLGGGIARSKGMVAFQKILRARLEQDPERAASDRRVEAELGEGYWKRHLRRISAMDPFCFEPLGLALCEHASWLDRLGDVRCPTLVMVGAEDTNFLEPANELARAIPGARQVVVPGAGHQPQIENAGFWRSVVTAYLAEVRGG